MTRMFFPYSFYPFKAMKIGYFFSKIKSPRTFYTRDDIYDYNITIPKECKISVLVSTFCTYCRNVVHAWIDF